MRICEADVEAFGRELDAIRGNIEDSLGLQTPPISVGRSSYNGRSTLRHGW